MSSNPVFVNDMNLFGNHIKQIPCIVGEGSPTESTAGAVGMLYMDSSNNGEIYKCVKVEDDKYTWEKLVGENNGANLNPVAKTEDMTQPVGVDKDGQLWTAPTAEEAEDMLVGVLPQTIPGAGYYMLSDKDATVTTDPGDGNAGPTNLLDGIESLNSSVTYTDGIITQVAQTAWVCIADLTPILEAGQLYTWAFESINVQTGNGFRVYAGDSPDATGELIANCSVYWADENSSGWTDSIGVKNGVSEATMTWDGTSQYVSLMVGGAAGTSYKLALYKGAVMDESEPVLTLELAAGEKKAMDSHIGKTFYSDSTVRLYKTAEQTEEAPVVDQRPLAGKHVLFIGDSLTTTVTGQDPETQGYIHAEKSYPDYFAEKTGCIAHNHGASGAWTPSYLEIVYPEIDFTIDYDIAIIMLGTNGGLSDVYGEAYANLIEQLAEDTGGKTQIFLVTPPYNNYDSSKANSAAWALDSNPVVHEMGQTYCLPVIDTYHDSGINQFNGALYRPIDDLHFNDAGYERLAGFIASQVLSKYWCKPHSGGNVTDEQVAATVDARLPDIIDGLLDKINIVGVVDDENNITIYGNLESGTYTLRYEHEDGTTTEIGSLAVVRDDTGEEEPDTPEKTLSSISASYTGGDVAVGTAASALTGVVVTAHYSDGTSEPVAGYTLSGTIVEGNNTITAAYQGKTATFTVTGVSGGGGESGSDSNEIPLEFTLGKISSSTGEITNDTSYAYSNLIEVTEGNKYEIVYTDIAATIKICYYDDSGNFISCSANELADAINSTSKQISGSIEVPIVDGAAYFRIRSYLYYFSDEGVSFELLRNGTKLTVAPSEEGAV